MTIVNFQILLLTFHQQLRYKILKSPVGLGCCHNFNALKTLKWNWRIFKRYHSIIFSAKSVDCIRLILLLFRRPPPVRLSPLRSRCVSFHSADSCTKSGEAVRSSDATRQFHLFYTEENDDFSFLREKTSRHFRFGSFDAQWNDRLMDSSELSVSGQWCRQTFRVQHTKPSIS